MLTRFPRRAIGGLLFLAIAASAVFLGTHAYQDWQRLKQPPAIGLQDPSRIRPWMTVRFIANSHRVPVAALAERLVAPVDGNVTLVELARQRGVPVPDEEKEARQAVADLGGIPSNPQSGPTRGSP